MTETAQKSATLFGSFTLRPTGGAGREDGSATRGERAWTPARAPRSTVERAAVRLHRGHSNWCVQLQRLHRDQNGRVRECAELH